MTLDSFLLILQSDKNEITRHLDAAKEAFRNAQAEWQEINALNAAKANMILYDAKLDMVNHYIELAKKIELPKTKMREFL